MKAIVYEKYGSPDVLQLREIEKPIVKENEVLIKVHAVGVNAADWHLMRGEPFAMRLMGFGFLSPKYKILGNDIAGTVEAVGKNVKEFKIGDEVFGDLSSYGFGGFAEYVCVVEEGVILKPATMSFEVAAAIPTAGVTALQAVRNKGAIQPGQKVLINGASGGVGTFAIQIAKALGAEVTAVCSTNKVEVVKKLGADKVIDYKTERLTETTVKYDLIIAANGYEGIFDYKRLLRANGVYLMTGGTTKQMFEAMLIGPWISLTGNKRMGNVMMKYNREDLSYMCNLVEQGKVKPLIDRIYSLEEVPEAIRYIDDGHALGKVIIRM